MGGTGTGKQLKRPCTIPYRPKKKIYRKPPIVTNDEKPIMGLRSNKNFIVSNAVENILARMLAFPYIPLDYPDFLAPRSIPQMKNYRNKKDFGKLPNYLRKIKENIHTEY